MNRMRFRESVNKFADLRIHGPVSRPTTLSEQMKIVFLDIEGVLVVPVPGRKTPAVSRRSVEQLNRITDATGAAIVLSSSLRFRPDICLTLEEWGVRARIIGRTPLVGGLGACRGAEIARWLAECPEPIENFVILDDEPIMGPLRSHLIQTDWNTGLTDALACEAIVQLS